MDSGSSMLQALVWGGKKDPFECLLLVT